MNDLSPLVDMSRHAISRLKDAPRITPEMLEIQRAANGELGSATPHARVIGPSSKINCRKDLPTISPREQERPNEGMTRLGIGTQEFGHQRLRRNPFGGSRATRSAVDLPSSRFNDCDDESMMVTLPVGGDGEPRPRSNFEIARAAYIGKGDSEFKATVKARAVAALTRVIPSKAIGGVMTKWRELNPRKEPDPSEVKAWKPIKRQLPRRIEEESEPPTPTSVSDDGIEGSNWPVR
jgi:hypothetical protein